MVSEDTLIIDLETVAREGKVLNFSLDNSYFERLDQEEISGGQVNVVLNVKRTEGGFFSLRYQVEGGVEVACDRCLDSFTLPVDAADEVKVFFEEPSAAYDNEDVRILPSRTTNYDTAWDIYEIACLSLPVQRVHPEGECNSEMMQRLEEMNAGGEYEN